MNYANFNYVNHINVVNFGNMNVNVDVSMNINGVPVHAPVNYGGAGVLNLEDGRNEEEEVEDNEDDDEDYVDEGEEGDIDEDSDDDDEEGDTDEDDMDEENALHDEEDAFNAGNALHEVMFDVERHINNVNDMFNQVQNYANMLNNFNVQDVRNPAYDQYYQGPFLGNVNPRAHYRNAPFYAPGARRQIGYPPQLDVDPALYAPQYVGGEAQLYNFHVPNLYIQHNLNQHAPQQYDEPPPVQPNIIEIEEDFEYETDNGVIDVDAEDYETASDDDGVIDVDAEDYESETASDGDDDDVIEVDAFGRPVAQNGGADAKDLLFIWSYFQVSAKTASSLLLVLLEPSRGNPPQATYAPRPPRPLFNKLGVS